MKIWYLLQSKPNQERIAQDNLIAQNYTVYCPKAKIKHKTINLFPRYLFIQLDQETDNFSPIRSTKGVANFVRFGVEFARVPEAIIEDIKIQEGATVDKMVDLSKFHQGDKVQIKEGAFKNQVAIFADYKSNERIIVLLKILGKMQKITLNPDKVQASY